ncbi:MAG: NifB/NifX family molybdenum-iron cluster-binding protein [Candidatus Omnitrophota bacterium]
MRVCIPSKSNEGLNSVVDDRFANARYFALYDTELKYLRMLKNTKNHHRYGKQHLQNMLKENQVDAVICQILSGKTLKEIHRAGIKIYQTDATKISEITQHIDEHLEQEIKPEDGIIHDEEPDNE